MLALISINKDLEEGNWELIAMHVKKFNPSLIFGYNIIIHWPYSAVCQAKQEHSKAKLFPLPVGLSSREFCCLSIPLIICNNEKNGKENELISSIHTWSTVVEPHKCADYIIVIIITMWIHVKQSLQWASRWPMTNQILWVSSKLCRSVTRDKSTIRQTSKQIWLFWRKKNNVYFIVTGQNYIQVKIFNPPIDWFSISFAS